MYITKCITLPHYNCYASTRNDTSAGMSASAVLDMDTDCECGDVFVVSFMWKWKHLQNSPTATLHTIDCMHDRIAYVLGCCCDNEMLYKRGTKPNSQHIGLYFEKLSRKQVAELKCLAKDTNATDKLGPRSRELANQLRDGSKSGRVGVTFDIWLGQTPSWSTIRSQCYKDVSYTSYYKIRFDNKECNCKDRLFELCKSAADTTYAPSYQYSGWGDMVIYCTPVSCSWLLCKPQNQVVCATLVLYLLVAALKTKNTEWRVLSQQQLFKLVPTLQHPRCCAGCCGCTQATPSSYKPEDLVEALISAGIVDNGQQPIRFCDKLSLQTGSHKTLALPALSPPMYMSISQCDR